MMLRFRLTKLMWIAVLILPLLVGCSTVADVDSSSQTVAETDATGEAERPANWTEESHSNDAEPNYEVVFPQDEVNQLVITIAPDQWEAMQANMVELFGEAGSGDGFAPPAGGGNFPPAREGDFPAPGEGERPEPPAGFPASGQPGGGGAGPGDITPENPMWVEATIEFEGNTWTHVGVRYKGNSSLTSGWREGTLKLPLKLDFDEFEDTYPEIDDQRFYGFKQLSLANGFMDSSFLRDAATYDILEAAGLPAAETAFYEVIIDYGEGEASLGLYTMIEVIDDTVVERTFGSDDGNIYEADGAAASLATGTYDQIPESFQKENNEDEADWSDIETLYTVLHSEQRTADPAAWRESLEAVFDVDNFLEWLAISAVIQHWDTYGAISHNFYLYNNPDTGQLSWISWDHNMAMSTGGGPGGRGNHGGQAATADRPFEGGRLGGSRTVTLDKEEVDENWPLIHYLLDDPVYYEMYLTYLEETVAGPFNAEQMAEKYAAMAALIAPYATADVGEEAFEAAVQQLVDHAYQRADDVAAFLATAESALLWDMEASDANHNFSALSTSHA